VARSDPDVLPEIDPEGSLLSSLVNEEVRVRASARSILIGLLLTIAGLVVFWVFTTSAHSTIVWTFASQPEGTVHVDSLVATPEGFALLAGPDEGGVTLWTSNNGITWSRRYVSGSPNRLLVAGNDLLAFSGRWVMRLGTDTDGETQVSRIDLPLLVRVGYGSGRPGLVAGSEGLVAQAFTGDVFWAAQGSPFEQVVAAPDWGEATGMPTRGACDPPNVSSVDVPPIVAIPNGFVTLVSVDSSDPFGIWPVCEPEVWASADGQDWKKISEGSPFGAGAYVYDMAWREGRLVSVGGIGFDQPALWVSDDGSSWKKAERLPSDDNFELREVAAGGLGWVVLGEKSDRPGLTGWVSPDGDCWRQLPSHVSGRQAAVGSDRLVLASHGTFPLIWVGLPTGGRQLGCD
jgi:hypothetical protein